MFQNLDELLCHKPGQALIFAFSVMAMPGMLAALADVSTVKFVSRYTQYLN